MPHPLTDEQAHAVDLANQGGNLKVEAFAGTGKTTTLVAMAKAAPQPATALYLVFNRSVKDEAKQRFPGSVVPMTSAGIAVKNIGDPWASRVRGPRMLSNEIARHLKLEGFDVESPWGRKRLRPSFLAGLIIRALRSFALSDRLEPNRFHVPIPRSAREDPTMLLMYKQIAKEVEPLLAPAWAEMTRPDSPLPISTEHLLKMWHLRGPVLPYDRIYFDEAQDANGCMRAIVEGAGAQAIWVGDSYQQINAWNGAVNALAKVTVDAEAHLTTSFRFGPEIAEVANQALGDLGCDRQLLGLGPPGEVTTVPDPEVRLSRTNATAVERALALAESGTRAHIIGGAGDVVQFCRSAEALQDPARVGGAEHPDLACFDSWAEVLAYTANDELGGDLAALVNLVTEFGATEIRRHLDNQPKEFEADVILSTAHKVKGREWPEVQLAEDFEAIPGSLVSDVEEVRLLYVAVTRAMRTLDIDDVPFFRQPATQGATAT